jgi:hypothetical protein
MANPLKILTVLTASEAAQFKKAVQVEAGGLTVSAGDTNVQALYATNLSGSGTVQVGGALTVAGNAALTTVTASNMSASGDLVVRDVYLRDSYLSGDARLNNAYLNSAYLSGSATFIDGVAFNSVTSSIKTLITQEATARIAGDIAVAATASANLNTVSGALKAYVDAQDIANSSSMKAYVDAQDSALSGALKTYVDAQDTALSGAFDTRITNLSGAVKTYVDAQDNALSGAFDTRITNLSGAVSSSVAAEAAARAAEDLTFLKLDGSRAMSGALDMGNQNITNAKSGSFAGDVTVGGNLQVNGQLTYVNSVNLEVTDKLVTIAKGAANGAAADGAGIEVDGAGVSFKYDNAAGKWVSDIGLSVANEASFGAAMKLSGSAFSYIATPIASGKFDVSDAIHALDVAVSGAVSAGGSDVANLKASYDALRQVVTGTLSSGAALLTLAGDQFAASQIDNLALDVMIDADSTGYTNDLVAIKMYVDGSAVKVQIDAPAAASAKYRLIVVNEKDGGLDVI